MAASSCNNSIYWPCANDEFAHIVRNILSERLLTGAQTQTKQMTSIYWPCANEDFAPYTERHQIQAGVRDIANASTPWDLSRAHHLVRSILYARIWDHRVTKYDALIKEFLVKRCGCPLELATEAVKYEWNNQSSDFARALAGQGGERVFAFLRQAPASPKLTESQTVDDEARERVFASLEQAPASAKLSKSQQRRERAKKTRAAYASARA